MRKILYIALGLLLAVPVCLRLSAEKLTPRQRAEKARYYYMEGVRLQAEDKSAEAYEMFKHAVRIDPEYVEALSAYGMGRLYNNDDSLQTPDAMLSSLEYLRPLIDKYPDDYQESLYYAYLASQLDDNDEAVRVYERITKLHPEKSSTLLLLADLYARLDSIPKAIDALTRYEVLEGKSMGLSSRKVSFLLAHGDTIGAIQEAKDFLDYNPKGVEGYIMLGAIYEATSQPDSALANYLTAERMYPELGRTKVVLANFYRGQNDSVKYDDYTYQALISEEFDLDQKVDILADYLSIMLTDKSDFSRGDHLFDVLSSQYPYEPVILDMAARYSYEKGDIDKAIEYINTAIDMTHDVEDYYGSLMSYYVESDRYQDAIDTYNRATQFITPGDGLKLIYATAATQNGDFDDATGMLVSLIDEIIPQAPLYDSLPMNEQVRALDYPSLMRASTLYGLVGDLCFQARQPEKAFAAYENAIRLMPYNYMTLNNYAYYMAMEDKDLDRAEELSKTAVDANPDLPTFLDTYAYILMKKGDYAQALEYQEKALKAAEENKDFDSDIYNHLGDILFHLDRVDDAVENWTRALELDPGNATLQKKIKTKTYIPDEKSAD